MQASELSKKQRKKNLKKIKQEFEKKFKQKLNKEKKIVSHLRHRTLKKLK